MTEDRTEEAGRWDELRKLAEAATPGPWEKYDTNEGVFPPCPSWSVANDAFHNPGPDDDEPWIAVDLHVGTETDARFIAAARSAVPALLAELDDTRAQLAEANRRATALRGVIDRCTAHIRNGMQLADDEPDAGLEALVVGWTKYHGDQCTFKARAEAAEAQVAAVEAELRKPTLTGPQQPSPKAAVEDVIRRVRAALSSGASRNELRSSPSGASPTTKEVPE